MATLRQKLAADFLKVDGLEAVTFARYNDEGQLTLSLPIPFALQRSIANDIIIDHVLIGPKQVTWWHVPTSVLNDVNIVPRTNGDAIIDQLGFIWVLWKIETMTFRTRYRFTCLKE